MSDVRIRKLISVANKRIKVKSRFALSKHVGARADRVLDEIVAVLGAVKETIPSCSFTTDLWTSRSQDAYISLTVHLIDR